MMTEPAVTKDQTNIYQPLPDTHPGNWLLMLDVDGTLLDIAHRPDAVHVPLSLKQTLLRLYDITNGAVVLVSGRSIHDLDTLFAPLRLPTVGLHGGERRLTAGKIRRHPIEVSDTLQTIAAEANLWGSEFPGILIETKPLSIAVHYRLNPEAGQFISVRAEALVRKLGPEWMVQQGKQVSEIKPTAFDKGALVRRLCDMPVFASRKPVYAGDDLTDNSAFEAVQAHNGIAIKVGGNCSHTQAYAESPAQLRQWLDCLAHRYNNNLHTQPLRKTSRKRAPMTDNRRIIVVSNRVSPPRGTKASSGGLAVAMSAVLQEHGGVWIGWSGKQSDSPATQVLHQGAVTYILQDITPQDYEQFYLQFCNGALWPILHYNVGLTDFVWPAYEAYLAMNKRYAELLASVLKPNDYIWVHDFHFIPLARYLRERGIKNRVGFFLHTPFPTKEVLTTLPVHREMLESLLEYDVIGFQTQHDLTAFHDCLHSASVHRKEAAIGRPEPVIGHFPISIQTKRFAQLSLKALHSQEAEDLQQSLNDRKLILGVDRLDYSKGITHRMKAVEELLNRSEEWKKQFTFLQISPPTREEIQHYAQLRSEVEALVGHINGKHADVDWLPIRFLVRGIRRELLAAFYRMARICLVTPLRDGMNLVAKEFIAAQNPEDPGVLVLSRFAGAAEEFQHALLVNPYDTQEMTNAIDQALRMPLAERQERWRNMYDILTRQTLEKWYQDYLDALIG